MLRTITLVTALLLTYAVSVQAQGMKFGVHVDPLISFLGSNEKDVTMAGSNFGFTFGVEAEYYFSEGENYALSFGANFALAKGGTLQYKYAGELLRNTALDPSQFTDVSGAFAPDTEGILLTPNAKVRYSVNYLEIPVGLKLRTNELGGSYLRAFFHLPLATIGIPVSARGKVDASTVSTDSLMYSGVSAGENVIREINFLQISLGTGAGVEYSPNAEGGLRITGGLYYNYGFIDITKKIGMQGFQSAVLEDLNPNNGFHNIALRVGIIF